MLIIAVNCGSSTNASTEKTRFYTTVQNGPSGTFVKFVALVLLAKTDIKPHRLEWYISTRWTKNCKKSASTKQKNHGEWIRFWKNFLNQQHHYRRSKESSYTGKLKKLLSVYYAKTQKSAKNKTFPAVQQTHYGPYDKKTGWFTLEITSPPSPFVNRRTDNLQSIEFPVRSNG